ncbi:MAG TPA: hypothetical protein VGE33_06795, partial [Thermomonas sp.]
GGTDRAQVRALLAREASLLRPAALGGPGYGLPQQERPGLEARAAALSAEVGGAWMRLRAAARAVLPAEDQAALQGTDANLAALGARLRALNRAQGGLELH